MAQGIFQVQLLASGHRHQFSVGSAGTHAWMEGHAPDPLACAAAVSLGADISALRARKLAPGDAGAELVLVMDNGNRDWLHEFAPGYGARVRLLGEFDPAACTGEIADPYGGSAAEFNATAGVIARCCSGLLDHLLREGAGPQARGNYFER